MPSDLPVDIRIRADEHATWDDLRWAQWMARRFTEEHPKRPANNAVVYTKGGVAVAMSAIDGPITHHRMQAAIHYTKKRAVSVVVRLTRQGGEDAE